jgi:hypothetical protein
MWSDRINLAQESLKVEVYKQSSMFGMNAVVVRKVPSSTDSLFNQRRSKHVVNSAMIAIWIGCRRIIIRPDGMQIIELTFSEYKINAYLILTVCFVGIKRKDNFMVVLL